MEDLTPDLGGNMKVLVIGATGLIGGHVLRAFRAAGCAAVGASRRRPADERADDWIAVSYTHLTLPTTPYV